jgi:NAD(P)-dependent dehydrogenase (short-subunit alcohol dehydrogenase family)
LPRSRARGGNGSSWKLVAEVEGKGGKWLQLDVDSPNSAQIVEDVTKSGQEIDLLVNNADFPIQPPPPNETFAEDEIRAQMESMYFGPLRLMRAVLPHMSKRRFGVIVNVSSGEALEARESMDAYAGAKAGLDGTCILHYSIACQP